MYTISLQFDSVEESWQRIVDSSQLWYVWDVSHVHSACCYWQAITRFRPFERSTNHKENQCVQSLSNKCWDVFFLCKTHPSKCLIHIHRDSYSYYCYHIEYVVCITMRQGKMWLTEQLKMRHFFLTVRVRIIVYDVNEIGLSNEHNQPSLWEYRGIMVSTWKHIVYIHSMNLHTMFFVFI